MDKTFMKITNKDIYDLINELKITNSVQHQKIIEHQIKTNGKVKTNRWIATTALSITLLLIGFCIVAL